MFWLNPRKSAHSCNLLGICLTRAQTLYRLGICFLQETGTNVCVGPFMPRHAQLDVRFNTSQEGEAASSPSSFHPSCGFALALLALPKLPSFLPWLGSALFWGWGVGEGWRVLPLIPSGCSGSSISSVKGSVFSRALSSLVEQPEPIRSLCDSSVKTGKERRGRGNN